MSDAASPIPPHALSNGDLTVAKGFWQRFRGLMGRAALRHAEGLLIRNCTSVHTCFMRFPIDVVYLASDGMVHKIAAGLKPWRASIGGLGAAHVIEIASGDAALRGWQVGDDLSALLPQDMAARRPAASPLAAARPGERGSAMIEFVLVGPVLTLLGLALLQYGMLFFAKNQLNYAGFLAARAGSTGNAKMASITNAYVRGLVPLYGGGSNTAELAEAYAKATADTVGNLRIQVLNPTKETFDDFNDPALQAVYGARAYSNTSQLYADPATIGGASGENKQDANLIKLRIVHGYSPKVPLINTIYTKYLQWLDPGDDAFHTFLVNAGRIPVVTNVTMQMQSDPVEDVNVSTPGAGDNGNPSDPGDPPKGGAGDPPNCGTIGCTSPSTPVDPGGGGGPHCP